MPAIAAQINANGAETERVFTLPESLDVDVAGGAVFVAVRLELVIEAVGDIVAEAVPIKAEEEPVAFVDALEALISKSGDSLSIE